MPAKQKQRKLTRDVLMWNWKACIELGIPMEEPRGLHWGKSARRKGS